MSSFETKTFGNIIMGNMSLISMFFCVSKYWLHMINVSPHGLICYWISDYSYKNKTYGILRLNRLKIKLKS